MATVLNQEFGRNILLYLCEHFGVKSCKGSSDGQSCVLAGTASSVRVMGRHLERVSEGKMQPFPSTWIECLDKNVLELLDENNGKRMEVLRRRGNASCIDSVWTKKKKGFYIYSFDPTSRYDTAALLNNFIIDQQEPSGSKKTLGQCVSLI